MIVNIKFIVHISKIRYIRHYEQSQSSTVTDVKLESKRVL